MINDRFRLFPEQGSTHAWHVDLLYFALLAMACLFTVLIASSIVYFAVKYRRGNTQVDRTESGNAGRVLEIGCVAVLFVISISLFVWGASLFFTAHRPPAGAIEMQVVAKQWMWKMQHANGRREINELHIPLGQPVKLSMISEDVIHSFFVPAFRIKQDVLPGGYSACWFEATRPGEFHLLCAEYCGTNHSRMKGRIVVLDPADYQAWLAGHPVNEPPAETGRRLFEELRCATCHSPRITPVRCPPLDNVFGHPVQLRDDKVVLADENYLRESILHPNAKVVKGYEPLMPSFDGQVNEEQLLQLIAYIKSLATP